MYKVNIEFGLMSIGHNIRKLAKKASKEEPFSFICHHTQRPIGLSILKNHKGLSKFKYWKNYISPIYKVA